MRQPYDCICRLVFGARKSVNCFVYSFGIVLVIIFMGDSKLQVMCTVHCTLILLHCYDTIFNWLRTFAKENSFLALGTSAMPYHAVCGQHKYTMWGLFMRKTFKEFSPDFRHATHRNSCNSVHNKNRFERRSNESSWWCCCSCCCCIFVHSTYAISIGQQWYNGWLWWRCDV